MAPSYGGHIVEIWQHFVAAKYTVMVNVTDDISVYTNNEFMQILETRNWVII